LTIKAFLLSSTTDSTNHHLPDKSMADSKEYFVIVVCMYACTTNIDAYYFIRSHFEEKKETHFLGCFSSAGLAH
jgi:hypothetical protein